MEPELNRRAILAGGLLSLSAVLAACSDGGSTSGRTDGAAGRTPGAASGTSSTAAAAAPPSPAAPTPSAVDLLSEAPACTLTPTTIAGPTWFDAGAVRSDIRDGRPGVPLDLAFRVERTGSCAPIAGVVVDLWQCDALGVYSGFAQATPGEGGRPGGRDRYGDAQAATTDGERYLRGTQVTGPDGVVAFRSIYPGWYPTRTAHLHLKVHLDRSTLLTTQLFFDDAVTDQVYTANDPYRQHPHRDTHNAKDAFYRPAAQLHLAPGTPPPSGGPAWRGAIVLGVR